MPAFLLRWVSFGVVSVYLIYHALAECFGHFWFFSLFLVKFIQNSNLTIFSSDKWRKQTIFNFTKYIKNILNLIWLMDFQGAPFKWLMKYKEPFTLWKSLYFEAKINVFCCEQWTSELSTNDSKFYESADNARTSYNKIYLNYFILFYTQEEGHCKQWRIENKIIKLCRAQS